MKKNVMRNISAGMIILILMLSCFYAGTGVEQKFGKVSNQTTEKIAVVKETLGGTAGGYYNGISDLEANAGYVGDVFGTAGNGAKLTQDDYKADLDAVNLSNRLANGGNAIQIIGDYYAGIESGENNRAREFIINLGEGDYDNGIAYLNEQKESNRQHLEGASGREHEIGNTALQNVRSEGDSLMEDIYSEKAKIENNFFESLCQDSNEYLEIEEVDKNLAENGIRSINQ